MTDKEIQKVLEKINETMAKIRTYRKAFIVDGNKVICSEYKLLLLKDKEWKVYVAMHWEKFDSSKLEPIAFITV